MHEVLLRFLSSTVLCDLYAHVLQSHFTGSGTIVWVPHFRWSDSEEHIRINHIKYPWRIWIKSDDAKPQLNTITHELCLWLWHLLNYHCNYMSSCSNRCFGFWVICFVSRIPLLFYTYFGYIKSHIIPPQYVRLQHIRKKCTAICRANVLYVNLKYILFHSHVFLCSRFYTTPEQRIITQSHTFPRS